MQTRDNNTNTIIAPSLSSHNSNDMRVNLQEELLFECERRQKEIYQNDQMTIQIAAYIIAFASAVIGLALPSITVDSVKVLLSLLVVIVTYLGLAQHNNRIQGTYINAAYIRIFVESQTLAIKWESRLSRFRELAPKNGVIDTVSHLGLIYLVIIAIGSMFMVHFAWGLDLWNDVSGYLGATSSQIIVVKATLSAMLFVLAGFFSVQEWRKYAIDDEINMRAYELAWKQIKDEELSGFSNIE